jgi:hypothetical protein
LARSRSRARAVRSRGRSHSAQAAGATTRKRLGYRRLVRSPAVVKRRFPYAGAPDHPSWLRPHAPAPPNDLLFREPRFISPSLRREGWDVNIKRTHRIYNELGLQGKAFPKLQVNEHKVARARAPQWRTKSLSHSSEASPWPPHRVHVVDDFVLYFQAKQRAHCRRLQKRDYARVAVPSDAHTPAKLPLWTDDYCEFYSHFGLKLRSPWEFMLLSA